MTFQEEAINAIRTSGGRVTPQRELIIDLLSTLEEDIDAEQLHRLATEHDPHISLPTVYRTLHTLEVSEIVTSRYVSSDHERKVYRANAEEDTFHFTCRKCGRLTAFQTDLLDQLKRNLSAQIGGEVLGLCMCANGLCADCRKEQDGMTLDQVQSGQTATVLKVGGTGAVRRRLMDMGLVKGTQVEMVRSAPMGDPVEYLVRGYHLSLRKSEAEMVEVELIG